MSKRKVSALWPPCPQRGDRSLRRGGLGGRVSALVLLLIGCFLLSVFSCRDRLSNYTFNYQYNYYPLDTTHYIDYIVDSITYNYNGTYMRDTAIYQVREVVSDTFYDNLNRLNYVLSLYRRPDSVSSWTFYKKWFARRDTTALLVTEDDLKFVKLVFPPQTGQGWNGNEYLPTTAPYDVFQNWNYYYAIVDTPVIINGLNFPHALVVSEVNNENLIQKTLRLEVYAQGVGMVYQAWENLSKQNVVADWNTGPENGFRIRWSVIGHYP